ncbi:metal-dependent phosphohydrolase [Kocuria varians]|uniref:Metal-dependent phosphohydrolase n=1 Tax=Kocuria varians TaxID=1272 RepID=A0A4Y4D123_KOCVA|nr:diguanylate cyclase [Kocuria varians]GEC98296.1 metal-dependent phosphohydrolase [Kocuria varians]
MTDTVAGIAVPDTALTREITQYIRDTEDDLLYHHSRRVFFFGALVGQAQDVSVDHELPYAGAMFHDRGLTEDHQKSTLRFEVDGANDVFEFLMERGTSRDRAQNAWLGIALHTTPGIPEFMAPEVALVSAGVETDVLGMHFDEVTEQRRRAVVELHPRPDFKNRILTAFHHGMEHRPGSTFGTMNADVLAHFDPEFERDDFVEIIKGNDWSE